MNDELLSDELKFALALPLNARAQSPELSEGFMRLSVRLIIRYTASISQEELKMQLEDIGAEFVSLINGYGIVTIPTERINELSGIAEIIYIDKPSIMYVAQ